MIKYLVDLKQKRNIVIIYLAKTRDEFVYKDVLKEAQDLLGVKVIYNESSTQGHLDANTIVREIPDYRLRTFYVSGSHGVVSSFENILKALQIPKKQVVTDYFPGFA
jgi:ferredoxin-NADP reductase